MTPTRLPSNIDKCYSDAFLPNDAIFGTRYNDYSDCPLVNFLPNKDQYTMCCDAFHRSP